MFSTPSNCKTAQDITLCVPGLRVVTSHFSGVVMIMLVAMISGLVRCMSPVSSRTVRPKGPSRFPKLRAISAAKAFIGAMYTTFEKKKKKLVFFSTEDLSWAQLNKMYR